MKKMIFLLILPLLLHLPSHAQVTFKTGLNICNMTSERAYVRSHIVTRFQIGLVTQGAELSSTVRLRPEFLVSWKGQAYRYKETFDDANANLERTIDTRYKDKFTYFEMPLLFHIKANENLFIEAGPSLALLLGAKKKGTTVQTTIDKASGATITTSEYQEDAKYSDKDKFPSGQETFAQRPVRFYDVSLCLGLQYKITDNFSSGIRYSYGLFDVFRNGYPFKEASASSELNKSFQICIFYTLSK